MVERTGKWVANHRCIESEVRADLLNTFRLVLIDEWISIANLYEVMISGILPRPIAFVSTVSEDGVGNLACFRYVLHRIPRTWD